MAQKKRLLLISVDAMMFEDMEYASTLPAFRFLIENGSRVNRLRIVYPSYTYPCHTTMLSGCWPDKHGIFNNTKETPGKCNAPWIWYHDPVRVPDLMTAAKKAGLKTAAIGWPVTGNHPDIDYLVDEIWPAASIKEEKEAVAELARLLRDSGTTEDIMNTCLTDELMAKRVKRQQPDTAWFSTYVCANILKTYRPEVCILHISAIDTFRHKYGANSPKIEEALRDSDAMISYLFSVLKEEDLWDETDIVVTADHGQIDVNGLVYINTFFREKGLIRTDEEGNVTDWDAWCFPSGASGQIRLKDPEDKELEDRVYTLLKELLNSGSAHFSRIFTRPELAAEHCGGDFAFMLETDGCTEFEEEWTGEYYKPLPSPIGAHGYHPEHGPSPSLYCYGQSFKQGVVLENAFLVDGAPTYAKLLGVPLPDADGRALEELLK